MHMQTITYPKNYAEWRKIARSLLAAKRPPQDLIWQPLDQDSLFGDPKPIYEKQDKQLRVPKDFIELARTVSTHRSDEQWAYLYTALWRITQGERHLLELSSDRITHQLKAFRKQISRDIHKMHAFVRFRKVGESPLTGREQFVAWFEPDHRIIRLTASFFKKRFHGMDWSILTPDECMHWDGEQILFTPGADKRQAPSEDAQDDLWRSYYRSIFNPTRLKVKAMQAEMPKKYWKNLPEAELIQELISEATQREEHMLTQENTTPKPAPNNAYLTHLSTLPDHR